MEKSPQKTCSRQGFKCRLYNLTKELERCLPPEPNYQNPLPHGRIGQAINLTRNGQRKMPGCCCRPGCCKSSMEYKPPDLDKLMGKGTTFGGQQQNSFGNTATSPMMSQPPVHTMGHLPWHRDDHSGGCFPGHSHGGQQQNSFGNTATSPMDWHRDNHNGGGFSGHSHGGQHQVRHSIDASPAHDHGGSSSSPTHPLEMTHAEFQSRGCFIARAA